MSDDNILQDEFLPELAVEITPSKFSDNVKIDLFRLDDNFMTYLVSKEVLSGEHNDDVQILPLVKAMKFITEIRDNYKQYRATTTAAGG